MRLPKLKVTMWVPAARQPQELQEAEGDLLVRAMRAVETRLDNLLGDLSPTETTRLLALEFSEVEDGFSLAGALAAVGAVSIIMTAHERGVEPHSVVTELRNLVTPDA